MTDYPRTLAEVPGLIDEHYEHAVLVVKARRVAAELPSQYRDVVERLCDAFVDIRTRYEDEVVEGMEQARIVARLGERLDALAVGG